MSRCGGFWVRAASVAGGLAAIVAPAAATGVPSAAAANPLTPARVTWKVAYQPRIPNAIMVGVAAPSLNSAWAFGYKQTKTGPGAYFLLRWNGSHWRASSMPVLGYHAAAIASSSASNVWLFGWTSAKQALALRWNGRHWLRIPWPGTAAFFAQSEAVISPDNVWVVAGSGLQHWNGHGWRTIQPPAKFLPGQISGSSATNLWI